jgi:pimeloyl-ACP methyl ester carboxylesterase
MLPAPFSIDDVAAAIVQWIQEMEINRPVLIGHSLGGYVTLAVANRIEKLPAGIGLFHSTALPDTEEKKANRNKVIEFVTRNGVKPYIDTFVPGLFYDKNSSSIPLVNRILSEARAEALTAYLAAMRDRPDSTGVIAKFTKPLLFLCGAKDELIPVETNEKQAKNAQKGTLTVLPGTGHMGMFEAPAESARALALFCDSCRQSGLF